MFVVDSLASSRMAMVVSPYVPSWHGRGMGAGRSGGFGCWCASGRRRLDVLARLCLLIRHLDPSFSKKIANASGHLSSFHQNTYRMSMAMLVYLRSTS